MMREGGGQSGPVDLGIARMIRRVALRQRFRGSLPQEARDREPFGVHLREREFVGAGPSDDDEIDTGRQEVGPGSKALAAEALDAIPLHGAPDLARDDQAQARQCAPRALRRHEEREMRRADAPPDALRTNELGVPAQPPVRAKPEPHATLGEGLLLVERRSQALASLATAIGEHLATPAGRHPGAEAVRASAADVVGLVGALHRSGPDARTLAARCGESPAARGVQR